jgi:hypothetical protein
VEREEHGMGPVHGKCQIVRMLYDHHSARDAIHRDVERSRRLVCPNLENVEDHKGGKISDKFTEIAECLKFFAH